MFFFLFLLSKTNNEFQFCLTVELFSGLKVTMHIFGAVEDYLGRRKLLWILLTLTNAFCFQMFMKFFYLPYLILFDRQTDQLTKKGKTEAPNWSLKSLWGKGFQ